MPRRSCRGRPLAGAVVAGLSFVRPGRTSDFKGALHGLRYVRNIVRSIIDEVDHVDELEWPVEGRCASRMKHTSDGNSDRAFPVELDRVLWIHAFG